MLQRRRADRQGQGDNEHVRERICGCVTERAQVATPAFGEDEWMHLKHLFCPISSRSQANPPTAMNPPTHEEIMIHQMRKLRRELRLLRHSVIYAAIGISAVIALGTPAFGLATMAAGIVIVLYCLARAAKFLADGWDMASMRWHRAKWQAEREKAVNDDL